MLILAMQTIIISNIITICLPGRLSSTTATYKFVKLNMYALQGVQLELLICEHCRSTT